MFNEIMDAVWDGKGKGAIQDLLAYTADYAVIHFATEEGFMRRYGYPDFICHKKLHDAFAEGVMKFLREYESNGATTEMVVAVVSDLGSWTREHIRGSDQELVKFLLDKMDVK